MKVLITGVAGFIGFHLTAKLSSEGYSIVGIDNLNDYYSPELKKIRISSLNDNINFYEGDLSDKKLLKKIFSEHAFDYVIHLAAQAGVRYSINNPDAYIESNIIGFQNLLESVRNSKTKHFLCASSSSVYGSREGGDFVEDDKTSKPVSLYAATKKSNEVCGFAYSKLYSIPITFMRFFTVYGEYGRPDMAYFNFSRSILSGEVINIFNNGEMKRDFTHVDDVTNAISKLMNKVPDIVDGAPYQIVNIGNNNPVQLSYFIELLETNLGKTAKKNYLPMQPGDVPSTFANIDKLEQLTGFSPRISIEKGISKFANWYKDFYRRHPEIWKENLKIKLY